MFHTADRTYIRVPGHPAVYEETKSGKPAEVTAVCADGICMIPKVLDKGYFTTGIAQKRIKFERRKKEVHHG